MELRQERPDALAGGDVEEEEAVVGSFTEHNLFAWVEATVHGALRARIRGAPSPRAAHSTEADVVRHIVG
jgi:hypothetical protein